VIDSSCNECGNMVNGSSSFVLENIAFTNSGSMLKTDGQDKLFGDLLGKTYVVGHVQTSNNGSVEDSAGALVNPTERGSLVDENGHYFTKSQPQYADWDVSSFSSVKDCGAKGNAFRNHYSCIAQANPPQATAKQTTPQPSTPPSSQTPNATKSPTSRTASTSSQTPSTSHPTAAS
jgi:glucan 1,3-beta-glucosidase